MCYRAQSADPLPRITDQILEAFSCEDGELRIYDKDKFNDLMKRNGLKRIGDPITEETLLQNEILNKETGE